MTAEPSMPLADVAAASLAVAGSASRVAKRDRIAAALSAAARADASDVAVVAAWLSGELPQGRIGVGWRTLHAASASASAAQSTLTVAGVDTRLSELAAVSGTGSSTRRADILSGLFAAATGDEQAFLRRLLSGELRQGALAGVMSDAIAAASGIDAATVRRAVMLTGSVPRTAELALSAGVTALRALRIEVGRPIAPMLASPAESMSEAYTSLGGDVVVDYKFDGARIQVHRDGPVVSIFTRSLQDVTARLPDIVAVVSEFDCESVILDGESLMLDDDGRPRPFQQTMSRFSTAQGLNEQDVLAPYFFDCLHLDGVDLIDEPLTTRLAALDAVVGSYRIPSAVPTSETDAQRINAAALAAGHEGVMVKARDSTYAAGRRGKAWQKVKPVHTLDLVVLAAEWGSGRRRGRLSNLHLGARDPDGGEPIMVGKTFKGLTDELLAWQTAEFPNHEHARDAHTVFLRPELVVEIEMDGAQTSSRYPGGVALRFARVLRYRPDKEASDADTIDSVRALLK